MTMMTHLDVRKLALEIESRLNLELSAKDMGWLEDRLLRAIRNQTQQDQAWEKYEGQ